MLSIQSSLFNQWIFQYHLFYSYLCYSKYLTIIISNILHSFSDDWLAQIPLGPFGWFLFFLGTLTIYSYHLLKKKVYPSKKLPLKTLWEGVFLNFFWIFEKVISTKPLSTQALTPSKKFCSLWGMTTLCKKWFSPQYFMFIHTSSNQRPIFFIDYTFTILYPSLNLSIVTICRLMERLRKKGQELINNISWFIFLVKS